MDWSIQEIAKLAKTTSRTLRHYGDLGLLPPSRIGSNGYRYYDETALVRLQRILMLRQLGLGLSSIAEVLATNADRAGAPRPSEQDALRVHLDWLRQEQDRVRRQIRSVESTIEKLEEGGQLMAEKMFDGFDHTQHRDEVEERWGTDAYARGDAWWRSMSAAEKAAWQQRQSALAADWAQAAEAGIDPECDEAQALAARQFDWLRGIPGTPGADAAGPPKEYFVGLGEMYVADDRFAAHYGGQVGARFVRDAMKVYADRNL